MPSSAASRRRLGRRLAPKIVAGLLLSLVAVGSSAEAPQRNGFRLEPAAVPLAEILAGGPRRDGIPALDHPPHESANGSSWSDDSLVLGVTRGGEARAYPVAVLTWHELVNDTLGGEPILVSFCPLCGTGIVFDRRVGGRSRSFGVSGLLYRSDLLLFDRESESLWSQISARAVTGPMLGRRLVLIRSSMESWGSWRARHPGTSILSRETGHRRPYHRSPYADYARSERLLFPVPLDRRYHPKMPTLGLRLASGEARAYPAAELARAGGGVEERFAGRPVAVTYDPEVQVFRFEAPSEVEAIEGYWFAWAAFHPETSVFTAPKQPVEAAEPPETPEASGASPLRR